MNYILFEQGILLGKKLVGDSLFMAGFGLCDSQILKRGVEIQAWKEFNRPKPCRLIVNLDVMMATRKDVRMKLSEVELTLANLLSLKLGRQKLFV